MGKGEAKGEGFGEGEGAGVGSGLMRCFLITVNIFFGLFGFILLAAGAFIKLGESLYMPFIDEIIQSIPSFTSGAGLEGAASPAADLQASFDLLLGGISIGLIILGVFLFITAILGCISACCQVKVIMIIYTVVLLVLLIAQIVFVILFGTGFFDNMIKDQLTGILQNDFIGIDSFTAESLLLNILMIQFKCCGIDGYKDFDSASVWNNKRTATITVAGQTVTQEIILQTPIACCKTEGTFPSVTLPDETCAYTPTPLNNYLEKGCFPELMAQLDQYRTIIIGVLAGIIVFQAILVIFVIVLLVLKGKEENDVV